MKEIIRRTLLSGATTAGTGTSVVSDVGPIYVGGDPVTNSLFVVTSKGSQTTGTIKIESADTIDYTGTWAVEATVTCANADTVQVVRVVGEMQAVRARVSATANGSGITVTMKAS